MILKPDLSDAVPELRRKVQLVLGDLRGQGYIPRLHEVLRTTERGEELKRRGSSQLGAKSKHCEGKAADIVDGRRIGGLQVWWGASTPDMSEQIRARRSEAAAAFFVDLGKSAKARGLIWGGDWTSLRDPAHVEVA